MCMEGENICANSDFKRNDGISWPFPKKMYSTFQAKTLLILPTCSHVSDEHALKPSPLPQSMPPC